jgi:hypothetical protein
MASRSLGSLTLDLILKYGGFEQGMDRASRTADKRMREIEARAKKFGTVIGSALAVGATAAVAGLTALTKNAIDSADRLNDISKRLGVGTEALSAWGYAAQQSGTDLESLNTGLTRFTKNVAAAMDSGSRQGEIFAALGISVKDAQGNLRSVEDLIPEIADSFKGLENATLESSLALELFGRSGAELLQFFNLGSDGLSEMEQRARALGIVISGDTAAAADEFNDEVANLKALVAALGTQLAADLLPAMTELVKRLQEVVKEGTSASNIANQLANALDFVATGAEFAYSRLDGIGKIIEGLTAGFVELAGAARAVFSGDFAQAARIFENSVSDALIAQGAYQITGGARGSSKSGPDFFNVRSGSSSSEVAKSSESALNRLFSGGDGKSKKKSGKSDAEKEAEQLKAAYDRMNESLAQQIALFGQDGEAARVRYEIEHGSLQKLTEAQKDGLLAQADKLDMMRAEAEMMQEADRRVQDETKAIERRAENQKNILSDMQFELSIMGLTNKERERAIALRYAEADATSEVGNAIADMSDQLYEAQRAQEVWDEFQRSMADAFVDLATGAKSLKDVIKDFFDSVAAAITRSIAEGWAEQLTAMFRPDGASGGAASGGASGAGFWANLAGALFGGGRAGGGSVSAGMFYRVNENGPEMLSVSGKDYLMMGNKSGMVTPRHAMAGGATLNQTFVVQGTPDSRTREQLARASGREAARGMSRTGR